MKVKVFYQWRLQWVIAEGDMPQLQFAAQFSLCRRAVALTLVGRVFHHVLNALHLRAHLYEFLTCRHHLVDGSHKRRHESLERQEHSYCEVAF